MISGSFEILSGKKQIIPIDVREFAKSIVEVGDDAEENQGLLEKVLPQSIKSSLTNDE